jgi:hypothetical protein
MEFRFILMLELDISADTEGVRGKYHREPLCRVRPSDLSISAFEVHVEER